MPRVGLEPTIPLFEREKTFLAMERAAILADTWDHPLQNTLIFSNRESDYFPSWRWVRILPQ
jgi:hypothetical protein